MNTQRMVEISDLKKSFGSVEALRGATLWANKGEVTAIVGDNGAGKSTLIKCLSGYHIPDSGKIVIDGETLQYSTPMEARRAGIETVYQDLALADQLTVWQNIFLNRELTTGVGPFRWLRRREMRASAQKLVEDLAVNVPSVQKSVKRLSGGQRQGVAIARAVMWSSNLMILDEPTAALGLREGGQVEALIKRVVSQGQTVVIISHNFEQVMRLSQQVWVMRGGKVISGHRTSEVTGVELVAEVTGATSFH